ncbi:MAG: recombinase family protein [Epsilonproteobacteria bacterium]|nr:recombinase family protein [Campylobacterota bacterium]
MTIAYIRTEKNFDAVHEQLQLINSYAQANNLVIDDEFIDHTSQNKTLDQREHVTKYFQSHQNSTLLFSDVWVLTTHMGDLIQMFSCLLRNQFEVHFIKQNVIMSDQSSVMMVLGLMDHLRQRLQEDAKRSIGRPKGSKSSSKFDVYFNEIIEYIKEGKSVSEMARILGVSRSSLKDYIESREMKQIAVGSLLTNLPDNGEEHLINTIVCPK